MRRVELGDAIESVRSQLSELGRNTAGKDLLFELGPVEIEFTVEVGFVGEGGATVKLWVLDAGAKHTASDTYTQTVRVTLEPKWRADGSRPQIGDRSEDGLAPRPGRR
jgi:hypothetical protein